MEVTPKQEKKTGLIVEWGGQGYGRETRGGILYTDSLCQKCWQTVTGEEPRTN